MKDTRAFDRDMIVAKSNELIQKSIYTLNNTDLQLVDFSVSKIKPSDYPEEWYSFSITDFCHARGITDDAGKYYIEIKESMQKLRDKSWLIKTDDNKLTTVSWFSKVKFAEKSGIIEFQFDPDVKRFLFDLQSDYSSYRLGNVLCFRSKYSVALYQILKSCIVKNYFDRSRAKEKIVEFGINDLKERLDCEQYKNFADFDKRALKPAVNEINKYCDEFTVVMEEVKHGVKVQKIIFILTEPTYGDKIIRRNNQRKQLNRR